MSIICMASFSRAQIPRGTMQSAKNAMKYVQDSNAMKYVQDYARRKKLPKVAVVDLQGTIMAKSSPLGRGKSINLETARKQIDSAFKIKPVSVLLNINSPGLAPFDT